MLTPAPTTDPTPVVDPVNHQAGQTAVGAGVLIVAGVMAWGATAIPADAGYSGVGPNFLPWVVAIVLGICGIVLIRKARRSGFLHMGDHDGEHPYWPGFAWMSAGMLLNAALITTLGFILSCTLCFMLAVRGLRISEGKPSGGLRQTVIDFVTGFLIAGPAFWLFTKLLGINLPGLTGTGWI